MSAPERSVWVPWVQLFLKSRGLRPQDIERSADGEVARLPDPIDGRPGPWTVQYSQWIRSQWRAWAAELGFTRDGAAEPAYQRALLAGHTQAEFDAWLIQKAGAR